MLMASVSKFSHSQQINFNLPINSTEPDENAPCQIETTFDMVFFANKLTWNTTSGHFFEVSIIFYKKTKKAERFKKKQ